MDQSERIQKALREGRATPSEVMAACNVSSATVSLWSTGKTKTLKAENLFPLAEATGFSARWIATGEGAEKEEGAPALPPPVSRLARLLSAAHKAGKLTKPLERAIESMLEAAAAVEPAQKPSGSRLQSREVREDLDMLQAIMDGQQQIRDEFERVLQDIRRAPSAEDGPAKGRAG